jgi:hypothetical protein
MNATVTTTHDFIESKRSEFETFYQYLHPASAHEVAWYITEAEGCFEDISRVALLLHRADEVLAEELRFSAENLESAGIELDLATTLRDCADLFDGITKWQFNQGTAANVAESVEIPVELPNGDIGLLYVPAADIPPGYTVTLGTGENERKIMLVPLHPNQETSP